MVTVLLYYFLRCGAWTYSARIVRTSGRTWVGKYGQTSDSQFFHGTPLAQSCALGAQELHY